MKKRGPLSSAALTVVAPIPAPAARLAAPSALTPAEAAVWLQTVSALPGEWFRADQAPLLARYCRHVARAEATEVLLAEIDPRVDLDRWAKLSRLAGEESRVILAIARSLRLTVQSRSHAVTAGNRAAAAQPARTPEDDRRAVAELIALRRADGK